MSQQEGPPSTVTDIVIPVPASGVCPPGYGGPIGGQCFRRVENPPGLGEVVLGGPGGITEVVGGLNPFTGLGGVATRIAVGALGAVLLVVGLLILAGESRTVAQVGRVTGIRR